MRRAATLASTYMTRAVRRVAAQVGTDTGTIYAIDPGMLKKLIEGGRWLEHWLDENYDRADKAVRQHGGAVFTTGGDGVWDVKIPTDEGKVPIVNEQGFEAPYGTPDFDERIRRVASEYLRLGGLPAEAAAYPGNLGMMEFVKFYAVATPQQIERMDRLIKQDQDAAWRFLQQVTKIKLFPRQSQPRSHTSV